MIELQGVTIRAGDYWVQDISFHVLAGEYMVLMGKTGIGKTTILEAICGLRPLVSGAVFIGGCDVSRWLPGDRNVGYVPQDLALFPTLTVRQHLEFAMKLRRRPRDEIEKRVTQLSLMLGVDSLLPRSIRGLSGGEAQRVALGRALSFGPSVLLLDEPLSALDSDTRAGAQELLRNLNKSTGVSVIHVTHNQDEADALADRCLFIERDPETKDLLLRE